MVRALLSHPGDILFCRSREERSDCEVDHHIQLLAEDLEAGGLPRGEAMLAARKQSGNVDRTGHSLRVSHPDSRAQLRPDAIGSSASFSASP